mmetsp:Transcript_2209/g.4941  ORF Transcript_2209/g.4941 Transcript_2209/m.4941 type:complete len:221 (-) Transcript_2209:155-817(-)
MAQQLRWLPHAESMEVTNDPRFMSDNVIAKRLVAFQTVSVVAVLMVNLSVKQMFLLEKNVHLNVVGVVQYTGFTIMTIVFLMDLFAVIVVVQQLFMTYRLLTAGPSGFEIAKSYYLNPNIVTMRHMAVKGFLCSLPLFVASTGCMVFVVFTKAGNPVLAIPTFALLAIASAALCFVNMKHSSIFKERYMLAKAHEQPLLSHVDAIASRSQSGGSFLGVDV